MKPDSFLMIPGPTPVPQAILEALARPPIGHRSEDFKSVMKSVYAGLKWVFQTTEPVFMYTASGTGAMEAAMINVLNAGDEILVLSCGVFSQRWAEIAKSLGYKVHVQQASAGETSDAESLEAFLKTPEGKAIRAVYFIHSETSTGVLNDVKALTQVVRLHSDALVIVDTVTSLGAAPFSFDDWGVDIAVSGSQKGFMLPPGLSFIAVSQRAMARHKECQSPGYYFNFSKHEKNIEPGQTPYTPAVTLATGLDKALSLLQEEGLPQVFERHRLNQQMVRAAMTAMGLSLFVPDETKASPAVTSVHAHSDFSVAKLRSGLREQFRITIADGQGDLAGKIFRIGHLGAIFPRDVLMTLASIEVVTHRLGYQATPLGTAVAAAQEVLIHHG